MLALAQLEADADPASGLAMDVVTDPANQFRFITKRPITNWAARTLAADQEAFYKPLDDERAALTPPLGPISRAGHIWRVVLKPDDDTPTP